MLLTSCKSNVVNTTVQQTYDLVVKTELYVSNLDSTNQIQSVEIPLRIIKMSSDFVAQKINNTELVLQLEHIDDILTIILLTTELATSNNDIEKVKLDIFRALTDVKKTMNYVASFAGMNLQQYSSKSVTHYSLITASMLRQDSVDLADYILSNTKLIEEYSE